MTLEDTATHIIEENTKSACKGMILDRYKVLEDLASTSFSTVFKAFDSKMQRIVAIKMIESTSKATTWAKREARLSAQLNHPNICTIFEYEETEKAHFLIMEYLEGRTLRDILDECDTLEIDEAVVIAKEVSLALEYAHLNYIIHQDIKPENILLLKDGRIKIMDFGTGRLLGHYKQKQNALIGTPAYMSPEQIQKKQLDDRTDQFSLAVVFYEMLAGSSPFDSQTTKAALFKVQNAKVSPLNKENPDVSEELAEVIDKALSKDSEDRYPTSTDFRYKLLRAHPVAEHGNKVLERLVERYGDEEEDDDDYREAAREPVGRIKDLAGRLYLKNRRLLRRMLTTLLVSSLGYVLFTDISSSFALIYFASLAGISLFFPAMSVLVLGVTALIALSLKGFIWPAAFLFVSAILWRVTAGRKRIIELSFSFAAPLLSIFNLQLLFPIFAGISFSPLSSLLVSLAGAVEVLVLTAFWSNQKVGANPIMLSQLIIWPVVSFLVSLALKNKDLQKTVVVSSIGYVSLIICYMAIGLTNKVSFDLFLKSASLSLIISLLVLPLIPYEYLDADK